MAGSFQLHNPKNSAALSGRGFYGFCPRGIGIGLACLAMGVMAGCMVPQKDQNLAIVPDNPGLNQEQNNSDSTDTSRTLSYRELLATGIQPKLEPAYEFPVSAQYKNGCFGFAVKHILQYKENRQMDMVEVEKKIQKPRSDLWTAVHIANFMEQYDFTLVSIQTADDLFDLLVKGEPVILQYRYPLADGNWVGHMVAAYSFDQEGIWISESITNQRIRLDYSQVFDESGYNALFPFSTVRSQSDG